MAQPITIHSVYSGMAQDFARDQLPAGTVWNSVDFIPNVLGAPLRKRGGWVYASSAVGGASYLQRVMVGTPGTGNPQLCIIDSVTSTSAGPRVWKVNETTGALTSIGSVTSASAAAAVGSFSVGDPCLFGKKWFIPIGYTDSYPDQTVPDSVTGFANATVYDGTTLSKIQITGGTTPPVGSASATPQGCRYITSYKSRLAYANTPKNSRVIWWSTAGKPGGDVVNDYLAYLNVPMTITGIVGLPTCLLVWGQDRTIRIRGSIPPPGSDFVLENLNDHGCADSRSIATWTGKAIYANTDGVYMTDGIDTVDLTAYAGMSGYLRTLLASFASSWQLRGVVFRNYYILNIQNGSGTFQDCLVCDLRNRSWFRLGNMNFNGYTVGSATNFGELYAAPQGVARLVRVTDIFTPAAANKADADGTAILPTVEYPCRRGFFRQMRKWMPTQGLTKWLRLYFTYDLRDAASDNPTIQVSYVTTPESSSYTTLSRTLAESTRMVRKALSFGPSGERGGKTCLALGIKLTQTANSSDTRIYSVEAEMDAVEGSRLEQS